MAHTGHLLAKNYVITRFLAMANPLQVLGQPLANRNWVENYWKMNNFHVHSLF